MKYLEIGQITTPFGLKGELKVRSDSDFISHRFRIGAKLFTLENNEYQLHVVSSFRVHKNIVLITIDQQYDINLVQKMVGKTIYADESDRPLLEDDEYYIDELVGKLVYNSDSQLIGTISDVIVAPSGQLLEIINNERRILIPFVSAFIKEITASKIIIEEIEGLC